MDLTRLTIRELILELTRVEDARRAFLADGTARPLHLARLHRRQEEICRELRARRAAEQPAE